MAKITFVADGIDQGKLWRGDGGAGGALDGDQGVSEVGESKEVEGETKASKWLPKKWPIHASFCLFLSFSTKIKTEKL